MVIREPLTLPLPAGLPTPLRTARFTESDVCVEVGELGEGVASFEHKTELRANLTQHYQVFQSQRKSVMNVSLSLSPVLQVCPRGARQS